MDADDRRFSAASTTTLSKLDELSAQLDAMRSGVDEIKAQMDAGVGAEELIPAKHRLAQLNGDLEKFQFTKVDAIETSELDTGKQEAKAHRKQLNARVEETQALIKALHERLRALEAGETAAPADVQPEEVAPQPAAAADTRQQPELTQVQQLKKGCCSVS